MLCRIIRVVVLVVLATFAREIAAQDIDSSLIEKAIAAEKFKIIRPSSGYLKNFEIIVAEPIERKMLFKHGMTLSQLEKAFNIWRSGPVASPDLDKGNDLAVRYYFISELKQGEFVQVVFDLDQHDRIVLISAYPTTFSRFRDFSYSKKAI